MTDYTVIRSRRRTLALEVTRQGAALVRAPLRATDADITRFVDSHRGWLEKHLAARQAYLSAHPEPSAAQTNAWRQQAKETLPPLWPTGPSAWACSPPVSLSPPPAPASAAAPAKTVSASPST